MAVDRPQIGQTYRLRCRDPIHDGTYLVCAYTPNSEIFEARNLSSMESWYVYEAELTSSADDDDRYFLCEERLF